MGAQRYCDVCKMYRQNRDGTPAVHRYGLSRQIPIPGKFRPGRANSLAVRRERHYGGIDLCDDCWNRIAGPRTRPDTRKKDAAQVRSEDYGPRLE